MESWDDDQALSPSKREPLLTSLSSSRPNRMDKANLSSDDDSDGDMAEDQSTGNPSAYLAEMGIRDKRSKEAAERKELIVKLFDENRKPKEIIKQLGLHRSTVQKILKASGRLDGSIKRRHPQEAAILQLFAEGVTRNEIIRRVKLCKRTLTKILLRYGKSFEQRNRRVPEPLRTTKVQSSAIRMLQKKGCARAQTARHFGIDKKAVRREMYLAQRTDRIISNIDGHQSSPEFPESRPNPSGSPTFPHDSDVQDVMAVGILEAATANSLSDRIQNNSSHSDILENPEHISTKSPYSALAGRRYRCDLCLVETHFEAAFISHVLGTKHAQLARRGVVVRCVACSFRTRQPKKMVGHAVAYQFHCPPGQADVYSIVKNSS